MQPEPPAALAQRLRSLREDRFPGIHLTQEQLARALSKGKPVSAPAISSWENRGKIPPVNRLESYARFFATPRSVAGDTPRLLADDELTEDEMAERDRLEAELMRLRDAALEPAPAPEPSPAQRPVVAVSTAPVAGSWYFPDRAPVTIVCAPLPERLRQSMPYSDPKDPDYIEAYTYADLDALIELFGHIRAVNPANQVWFRRASELVEDDYTTHLVLLGGVDWNDVAAELLEFFDIPVRQLSNNVEGEDWDAWFEVDTGADRIEYRPRLDDVRGRKVLREDIAHFLRAPNPFNQRRTVTFCSGMYGRGTVGAVRALTDQRFRDRNEEYLDDRFGGSDTFGILMKVRMAPGGKVITPDWTRADNRLHEWPKDES
jgi:transcriptional regulator with XRE-family HTH domain